MKNVQITKERLLELEKAEAKLTALENGGVDNWEWYGEAMDALLKQQEFDAEVDATFDELVGELMSGAYEPSERGAGFAPSDDGFESALKLFKDFILKVQQGKVSE